MPLSTPSSGYMRQSMNVPALGGDGNGSGTQSVSLAHNVVDVQSVVIGASANDSVSRYPDICIPYVSFTNHFSYLLCLWTAARPRSISEDPPTCAQHHTDSCAVRSDVHRKAEAVAVVHRCAHEGARYQTCLQGGYGDSDTGGTCFL